MSMLDIEWDWEDIARVLADEARDHMDDSMPATEEQMHKLTVEAAGEVLKSMVTETIEKARAAAIEKYGTGKETSR